MALLHLLFRQHQPAFSGQALPPGPQHWLPRRGGFWTLAAPLKCVSFMWPGGRNCGAGREDLERRKNLDEPSMGKGLGMKGHPDSWGASSMGERQAMETLVLMPQRIPTGSLQISSFWLPESLPSLIGLGFCLFCFSLVLGSGSISCMSGKFYQQSSIYVCYTSPTSAGVQPKCRCHPFTLQLAWFTCR